MKIQRCQSMDEITPLFTQWYAKCAKDAFGLEFDLQAVYDDLEFWLERYIGAVFVAQDKDETVGLMAVFKLQNYISPKPLAIEKYWYGKGGLELYRTAMDWAGEQGCGHFLATSSCLAGAGHERVKTLYEKLGMKPFESTFIIEV